MKCVWFKLCRCTYFTSSSLQIGLLLGYYELNYAYIRESLTLIFLHLPKPYRYTYYAINRASRRRPLRTVIVTPRIFRPRSLYAPRINSSHSTSHSLIATSVPRSLPPRTSQFTHALHARSFVRWWKCCGQWYQWLQRDQEDTRYFLWATALMRWSWMS